MKFNVTQYEINLLDRSSSFGEYEIFDEKYLDDAQDITTAYKIEVCENYETIKTCLITGSEGVTTVYESMFCIDDDRIVLCCSNLIYCLEIPTLKLLWKTKADTICCFQIFKMNSRYITHGELEISCLDENGTLLWQQSGRDMFASLDGTNEFEVTADYIFATDWDNNSYRFDFNGNLID